MSLVVSSSPIATTRPPEDKGCLGPKPADPTEVDEGTGFRRTGDALLFLAWNVDKEGAFIVEGFGRAGAAAVEVVEIEGAPVIFRCTSSIVA